MSCALLGDDSADTRVACGERGSEGILIECELTLSALETLFAEREGWEGDVHGGSYNR